MHSQQGRVWELDLRMWALHAGKRLTNMQQICEQLLVVPASVASGVRSCTAYCTYGSRHAGTHCAGYTQPHGASCKHVGVHHDQLQVCVLCSVLERLKNEMQSGTFEFRDTHTFTETITMRAVMDKQHLPTSVNTSYTIERNRDGFMSDVSMQDASAIKGAASRTTPGATLCEWCCVWCSMISTSPEDNVSSKNATHLHVYVAK